MYRNSFGSVFKVFKVHWLQ